MASVCSIAVIGSVRSSRVFALWPAKPLLFHASDCTLSVIAGGAMCVCNRSCVQMVRLAVPSVDV